MLVVPGWQVETGISFLKHNVAVIVEGEREIRSNRLDRQILGHLYAGLTVLNHYLDLDNGHLGLILIICCLIMVICCLMMVICCLIMVICCPIMVICFLIMVA